MGYHFLMSKLSHLVSALALAIVTTSVCNAQQLTVSDILTLKSNGVSDQVIVALIQARTNIVAVSPTSRANVIYDVESYDFFKHYYLVPRAMSYRYRLMMSPYTMRHRDNLWHR
jgi:hypothetical protein